ncbi:hypothetical protein [Parvibaculum sp.]|uniref:hypothetical protein n=1 Tax=Parvibaculum sp. TaxID=2024848 RepID=UPI00320FDD33
MASPDGQVSRFTRFLASGAAFLIGIVLIGLALPRAAAYFEIVSWRDLSQLAPTPTDTLEETDAQLAAYRRAAAWLPDDALLQQFRGRLALLALRPDPSKNASMKEEAASGLRAAVAAAPNRACAWAIYAYAGSRYALPSVSVEPAVRLAYILSPPSPACAALRLSAVLSLPQRVPDDMKAYAEADLRGLWHSRMRRELAYIYRDAPQGVRAFIISAVSDGKGDRAWMDRFVKEVTDADRLRQSEAR